MEARASTWCTGSARADVGVQSVLLLVDDSKDSLLRVSAAINLATWVQVVHYGNPFAEVAAGNDALYARTCNATLPTT